MKIIAENAKYRLILSDLGTIRLLELDADCFGTYYWRVIDNLACCFDKSNNNIVENLIKEFYEKN